MNLRKQLLTNNACYIYGRRIDPCGVVVHSTGSNNPTLKRYVAPDDGLIGKNLYDNDWNQYTPGGRKVCVHAFIGKLADGSIATYQTLPWDMEGWHAGGSANQKGYIGFEICEDGLTDPVYFNKVYKEAAELTAYLCKTFGLNPLKDGVVICHHEAYERGIGSPHVDVTHWFPKHGKTMDDFRAYVAQLMKEEEIIVDPYEQFKQYMARYRGELHDNDSSDWSEDARKFVIEKGIVVGTGEGEDGKPNYAWEDMLTREQMAQMMFMFAKVMGMI